MASFYDFCSLFSPAAELQVVPALPPFNATQNTSCVTIQPIPDLLVELPSLISLSLLSEDEAVDGIDSAMLTINDDDSKTNACWS